MIAAEDDRRTAERRAYIDAETFADLRDRVVRLENWIVASLFQGFLTLAGGTAFVCWYVATHH